MIQRCDQTDTSNSVHYSIWIVIPTRLRTHSSVAELSANEYRRENYFVFGTISAFEQKFAAGLDPGVVRFDLTASAMCRSRYNGLRDSYGL